MQLFERAYQALEDGTEIENFADSVAKAMARFAEPFPDDENNMCYPHFLLHGIARPTLDEVVARVDTSSRIIQETLAQRDHIKARYRRRDVPNDKRGITAGNGGVEDYFGMILTMHDWNGEISRSPFLAQTSFFVDTSNSDVYVMSLQGPKLGTGEETPEATADLKERKALYDQLGNRIGMSPRRFMLAELQRFATEEGYRRIRVIHPHQHPMFIESHKGFMASYERVIRKAGITTENECYLERKLE